MQSDDPMNGYMLQAGARICKVCPLNHHPPTPPRLARGALAPLAELTADGGSCGAPKMLRQWPGDSKTQLSRELWLVGMRLMPSRLALVAEAGCTGGGVPDGMLFGGVQVLGQDFLPYMDIVMPPLLRAAQLKPDVNITTGSEADDDEDADDDEVVHPPGLSVATAATETSENAMASSSSDLLFSLLT